MSTPASELSGMANQFQSNTPLMQDPTAAAPLGPLETPSVAVSPIAQPSPAEKAAAGYQDPEELRQKALAEAEGATQQEAAAYGAYSGKLTQAAGALETDVTAARDASIAEIDKRVKMLDQQQAQRDALAEKQAQLSEREAADLQNQEVQLDRWIGQTPTRQAAAAAAMHVAAPLSILTALGGAMTRQSGIAMLGALNGVVEGIQQGAENKFEDAMDVWQKAYDQMKHHQETTRQVYNTYLDAYKGRIDAQDKAIDHTNTVMGDNLQKAQLQVGAAKDIFAAKDKAYDAVMKYGVALAKIRETRAARMQADMQYNQSVIDLYASRIAQGEDPSKVFAGMRSAKNAPFQAAVWQRAEEMWYQQPENANNPKYIEHPELKSMDAAEFFRNARLRVRSAETAATVAGRQVAGVEFADKLLDRNIPLAWQAMERMQRTGGANAKFIPYNEWKNHAEYYVSHPELRQLELAVNAVIADYNMLNKRTGTSSMTERLENMKVLTTTDDPVMFLKALQQMHSEAIAARLAGRDAMNPSTYLGGPSGQLGGGGGGGGDEGVGDIGVPGIGGAAAPNDDPANLGIR